MMAKIVKGSDFKGAVDYIIDKKKDTQIVASEGLFMENLETIAMSFNAQSRMNDKVRQTPRTTFPAHIPKTES